MPNHFSSIGFDVQSGDGITEVAQKVADLAQVISTKRGQYLRWAGDSGEEIWLQIDEGGNLVGMNPHFSGSSLIRVRLLAHVNRAGDTALDGAFHGWADPDQHSPENGAYPIVFDSPDAATHSNIELPNIVEAQIAAFAHEASFYKSVDAFSAVQATKKIKFASQSFIPTGMFRSGGAAIETPQALAFLSGHVLKAGIRRNSLSGGSFYWALVETLGGSYDVVLDKGLLEEVPHAGGVLSGSFWLTGRILRS